MEPPEFIIGLSPSAYGYACRASCAWACPVRRTVRAPGPFASEKACALTPQSVGVLRASVCKSPCLSGEWMHRAATACWTSIPRLGTGFPELAAATGRGDRRQVCRGGGQVYGLKGSVKKMGRLTSRPPAIALSRFVLLWCALFSALCTRLDFTRTDLHVKQNCAIPAIPHPWREVQETGPVWQD
jgi:hypothetical protein